MNRNRPRPKREQLAGRGRKSPAGIGVQTSGSQKGRMKEFDTGTGPQNARPRTINPFANTEAAGENRLPMTIADVRRRLEIARRDARADLAAEEEPIAAKKPKKGRGKTGLQKQLAQEMREYGTNVYEESLIGHVLENINELPLGTIAYQAAIRGVKGIREIFNRRGVILPLVMTANYFREINGKWRLKPGKVLNNFVLVPAETFAREHKVDVKFLISGLRKWKGVVYYGKCGKREVPFINKSIIKWLRIIINAAGQKEIVIEKRPIAYRPTARARAGAR